MAPGEPQDPEKLRIEREKLQAEANSVKTKALKEEREEREAAEPSAVAEREALHRQKVAESEKAVAAAQREQAAALIPDFKDVGRGKLENKSEKPMFEVVLGQRALSDAARKAATVVHACLEPVAGKRVLVIDDPELTTSDATYQDVDASLTQLTAAAEEALNEPESSTGEAGPPDRGETFALPLAGISAVASAIPALLGVFSAQRTLSASDISKNDLAAAAALVGAVLAVEGPAPELLHDDVRVLPVDGTTATKHATLVTLRRRLATLQVDLEAQKAEVQESDKAASTRIRARLGRIASACSAIDQFSASAVTAPQGGGRSPLSMAAAREQLHDGHFTHVLLVKSEGGSVQQTLDDKPFMFGDKVSIVAASSITWILFDVATNAILGADTAGGTATAHGKVGDRIEISLD